MNDLDARRLLQGVRSAMRLRASFLHSAATLISQSAPPRLRFECKRLPRAPPSLGDIIAFRI